MGDALRHHRHMAAMVALERSIERRIEDLSRDLPEDARAGPVLRDLREVNHAQRHALEARLRAVAPGVGIPEAVAAVTPLEPLLGAAYPASGALVAVHGLLGQAVLGYAMLMQLAFRAADSVERLGPENTGDLARVHMRAYAAIAQQLATVLPLVVVDELEQEELECRCTCPGCGLGVCLCAFAFRRQLGLAWSDGGPLEMGRGISLVRPRAGSPAARAGLEKGDEILAADATEIESLAILDSIPLLQQTIKSHGPGEAIRLRLRRSGEELDRSLARS